MPIFPYYDNPEKAIKELMPNGGNEAEAALYLFLKEQLPAHWYVVHNIHFRGNGENQMDFLIIANGTPQYPNAKGIVNLECKGKSYEINGNGTFSLNGIYCDPIGQSKGAIINFYNSIKEEIFEGKNFSIYGNAVVFPTRPLTEKDREALVNVNSWLFDEKDCGDICGIVDSVLDRSRKDLLKKNNNMTSRDLATLNLQDAKTVFGRYSRRVLLSAADPEKTLEKFSELGVRLSNAQLLRDANLFMLGALNHAQKQVCKKIAADRNKTFHVSGGAGTGKTLIGFAVAEKFIKENPEKQVLYICYNSSLAAFHNIKNSSENLTITSFFRLPYLCFTPNAAKEIFKSDMGCEEENWKEKIVPQIQDKWNSMQNRRPDTIPDGLFDLIIIDEAQDFNEKMVDFTFSLKKPDAQIIFLSDKVQNIYEDNPCIEQIKPEKLDSNLRNTKPIDQFSCEPIDLEVTADVEGPEVSERCGDYEALQDCIEEVITKYCFSQIAVLTDSQDVLSAIEDNSIYKFSTPDKKFKNTVERLKQWQQNKKIWKSTVHAFKGLEAECVIYVKTNNVAKNQVKIDYIGATRAKYQLIVFSLT